MARTTRQGVPSATVIGGTLRLTTLPAPMWTLLPNPAWNGGSGTVRSPTGPKIATSSERHVPSGGDWASGYTELQCPGGHFLTGYSVRGAAVPAAPCAKAAPGGITGTSGRTVWFGRSDNRDTLPEGGDFAHGHYKGRCADGGYAADIAWTGRIGSSRPPDALYCRELG